ncbi:nuclear transport factor 2 family protein [Rhodococcus globerulus]|uniref:nuclear transport factor 2 family protein n=1 Tax=Rhodococcus globerulus TaxID=33008 RepID=UPI001112875E|nr:nuclear transport factor 2 family protein [Rhodococcus globerulus]
MTQELERADLAGLAERYSAAWIARDVDGVVALHTPESLFVSHGRPQTARGHEALRTAFSDVFETYPQFGVDTHRLLFGDTHWVLDWTLSFEPPGQARRGFRCVDVVEVSDGLVARKDTYVDTAEARTAVRSAQ